MNNFSNEPFSNCLKPFSEKLMQEIKNSYGEKGVGEIGVHRDESLQRAHCGILVVIGICCRDCNRKLFSQSSLPAESLQIDF